MSSTPGLAGQAARQGVALPPKGDSPLTLWQELWRFGAVVAALSPADDRPSLMVTEDELGRPPGSAGTRARHTVLRRGGGPVDRGDMDAAEPKEILSRYMDHQRRFDAAAARRDAEVIPFNGPLRKLEQEPTMREVEVLAVDLGRPPEPRDRHPALPVGGDGEVARAPPARQAAGAIARACRGRRLPPRHHRVSSVGPGARGGRNENRTSKTPRVYQRPGVSLGDG